MARGGKLNVEIDYVRLTNGEKVALRAIKETSGGGHTGGMVGGMVATAIVVWPAAPLFLFMHGKDTTIAKGTEIAAYTNGEIKLDPTKFGVMPKSVSTVVSVPSVAAKPSSSRLTNREILALKKAGLSDDVIAAKIAATPAEYQLDVNSFIDLKKAGLSDSIIAAMLQASQK